MTDMKITAIAIVSDKKRCPISAAKSRRQYPELDEGDQLLAYFDVAATGSIIFRGCLLIGTEQGSVRMQIPRGKDGNIIVSLSDEAHQEMVDAACSAWSALVALPPLPPFPGEAVA